jgi:hypothetical protein
LPIPRVSADTGLTLAVGGLLTAIAFTADGGLRLERTTWTEVGLMLLGAAVVAAALVSRGMQGRLYGGVMLLGFAALSAFTAVSIIWSLSPADSWLEANRTFAYLAVLAGALALARLTPHRWTAVLHGVSLGCVLISIWALTTKVFPGALSADETYARLREPFGYWNSVGLMAALGVPPVLWLAARRSGHPAANALAWPALGLLFTCLMLSYSRGALLALLIGLAYWFAAVPLRLRGAVPLIAATAASAALVGWAFARDALSAERIPLAARVDAGHDLGALLVLMAAVLLAAGLAAGFLTHSRPPAARVRRFAGRALLALLVCIPLAAVGLVAAAPGGIKGQTTKTWDELTSPTAGTPANTPDRLTATSSVRARYWREALDVFRASSTVGAGAGAFVVARTRYRTDNLAVRHAHGYAVQTLADLGLIGLALSLVAAVGWAVAALRVTGVPGRDRGVPFDPERIGLITMTSVVVVFGVHSLVDWTWFVPANAVVGLLCAGWVAGRVPLRERLSSLGGGASRRAPESRRGWRAALRSSRFGVAAAIGVLVVAGVAGWAALQPVRAAHAEDGAIDSLALGDYDAAGRKARTAERENPLSLDPLWQLAFIADARGDKRAASRALERAARLQPANAEAWRRLGRYRLSVLEEPKSALKAFQAAYFLDPAALRSASDVLEASRAVQAKG